MQHYEHLTRFANDIVILVEEGRRIVEVNQRACEVYGYSREELLALPPRNLRPEALRAGFDEVIARTRPGDRMLFETVHQREDGSTFPVEISVHAMDVEGRLFQQAIIRDITERKRHEEALRTQAQMIVQIDDAIVTTDLSGNITSWNPGAERMFGYAEREALGRHISLLHPGQLRADLDQQVMEPLLRQGRHHVEVATRRKSGEEIQVALALSLLRDPEGKVVGMIGLSRDVSQLRRAEAERTSLEAQLAQSQRMEPLGRLAGGVAHDFNNLLTVILGSADLARMEVASPGARLAERLEEIARAGERARELTRQLLAFGRKQVLEIEEVDLNVLILDFSRMLRRLIGEDIEVRTELCPGLDTVRADPTQLEQIVLNLAVNARDAMAGGGVLTIKTDNVVLDEAAVQGRDGLSPGPYVMLAVGDTGCGMSDEVRERIFEPFFTTKEKGKGTGLGLSTVYGIVRQHNGDITVESAPGRGAHFRILLPRAEPVAMDAATVEAERPLERGHETVLVVEDDPSVRRLVASMLAAQGYRVLEARGGFEAVRRARENSAIDLLLTDVVMPELRGPQVRRAVAAFHPRVRVLYMSGYTDQAGDEAQTMESGSL